MIYIKVMVMLLKISPNEIIQTETLKITFPYIHSTEIPHKIQSLKPAKHFHHVQILQFFVCKDSSKFSFQTKSLKFKSSPQPKLFSTREIENRNKHASNTTKDRDKNQDDRLYSSELSELRQPYTSLGIANQTLDETVIKNENGLEADHHIRTEGVGLADYHTVTGVGLADYHLVTGPIKNILRQSSNKTNITNTIGRNAEHLCLKHPEPPEPVNQIP